MSFRPAALTFFRQLSTNNQKAWFELHREEYLREVREPMRALIEEMNDRMRRFAPEMGGDPKRSLFRINRDTRFSRDKSPYKLNAGCWFNHRAASHKVGGEADGGSAGFYFHFQPGRSFVGAGIWMPPRPQLAKLRDAIAEDPKGFERAVKALPRRFGGLSHDDSLRRMPRGYAETHPAARWLRCQSFVTGRTLTDAQVTSARLPTLLAKDSEDALPLVRWLNRALGYSAR